MLTISIIVHNDYSHIDRALASLFANSALPLTLYITINTGESPEAARLQAAFPQVHYLVNSQPAGFATNHNRVMHIAQTPYVALINDDVEMPMGMIEQLMVYLEAHPKVGLVTPRILNPDGTPQLTTFSDPTLLRMVYRISGFGHLTRQGSFLRKVAVRLGINRLLGVSSLKEYSVSQSVPVAVGVAMFARREAYQQAGMMDEDTRVNGEEYGWHWRLRQHGWQVHIVTETYITHFNTQQNLSGWFLVEHRKGILNYFCRYRPGWQAITLRGALIFFHGVRAVVNTLFNRKAAPYDWQIVGMAWRWRPMLSLTPQPTHK
jgi:hypothetical protein